MNKNLSFSAFDIVNILVLCLFGILCLYPFWYMIVYSFSSPSQAAHGISIVPVGFTLSNYFMVITLPNIGRAAVISVLKTVVGTASTLFCCSLFAYLVTKPLYGRKIIYRLLVVTMYVSGGLIPTFLIMRLYGLNNTYWIFLMPTLLSAYDIILIKTFIEQLPESMEESAMIDGAGPLRRFWNIVLPLSKPILATIALFAAVGQWNAWFDTHIYITKKDMYPLQYILYRYLQEAQNAAKAAEESVSDVVLQEELTPATFRMTITAIVTLPILFVYPFMQRYYIKGIMIGAVKG